jgi:hypothetical protein
MRRFSSNKWLPLIGLELYRELMLYRKDNFSKPVCICLNKVPLMVLLTLLALFEWSAIKEFFRLRNDF